MKTMNPKTRNLTIYLIKDSVKDIPSILTEDFRYLRGLKVDIPGVADAKLFLKPSSSHPPSWLDFFENVCDFSGFNIINSSTSALLILQRNNRFYALPFGYGRQFIEESSYEERFGLKVCLNTIAHDKIRSIDKRTFDAIARHTREQANRAVPASDFGINIDQDILRAITGIPEDSTLGNRMTGMSSLVVSVKIDIYGVPNLLDHYVKKFSDTSYKQHYPWIDQIAEISSKITLRHSSRRLKGLGFNVSIAKIGWVGTLSKGNNPDVEI